MEKKEYIERGAMTDNDIIKALERCNDPILTCEGCPLKRAGSCLNAIKKYALNLINRQKAEIDILCNSLDVSSQNLENMARAMPNIAKATRIEAIKVFAQRLKKQMKLRTEYDEGGWDIDLYTVTEEDVDNLVKEMTEGEDESVVG